MKLTPIVKCLLGFLFLFSIQKSGNATDFYWVGDSSEYWSDAANWSATSGGTGGLGIPGMADVVYIDGNDNNNCQLDTVTHIFSLYQSGGDFNGGNFDITTSYHYEISGGNHIASSGISDVKYNLKFTGGTFDSNSGIFKKGRSCVITGDFIFATLEISAEQGQVVTIASGSNIVVEDKLHLSSDTSNVNASYLNGPGTVELKGDLIFNNNNANSSGSAWVTMNGTSDQIIEGLSGKEGGGLPNIEINKTSGKVFLKGDVLFHEELVVSAGVLDGISDSSTTYLRKHATTLKTEGTGKIDFFNFVISPYVGSVFDIVAGSDISVANDFILDEGASPTMHFNLNGPGGIHAKGNVIMNNPSAATTGTAWIVFDGDGDQIIEGLKGKEAGGLPNIEINKLSGTVYLKGDIVFNKELFVLNGLMDGTTHNASVYLKRSGTSLKTEGSGSMVLEDLHFYPLGHASFDIVHGSDITVSNRLFIEEGATIGHYLTLYGSGTIKLEGDLEFSNSAIATTGTAWIKFTGNGDQVIEGLADKDGGGLTNIEIDKSSGSVLLKGDIVFNKELFVLNGLLEGTTHDANVYLRRSNTSLKTEGSGSMVFGNLFFYPLGHTSFDVVSGSDIVVEDTLMFAEGTGGYLLVNGPGEIHLKGNLKMTNTHSTTNGTVKIVLDGELDQIIEGSSGITGGGYANIEVNKTNGSKVLLKGDIVLNKGINVIEGLVEATTHQSDVYIRRTGVKLETSINSTIDFYNLHLKPILQAISTVQSGSNINVLNDLKLSQSDNTTGYTYSYLNGPGEIDLYGDLYLDASSTLLYGTSTINMIGDATSHIYGNTTGDYTSKSPNILIDKSDDSIRIELHDNLLISGNFNVTKGKVIANNSSMFLKSTSTVSGVFDVKNLIISPYGHSTYTLLENTVINVLQDFKYLGNYYAYVNGAGLIKVHGDIHMGNTKPYTGNADVVLVGGQSQNIYGVPSSDIYFSGRFNPLRIEKDSLSAVFLHDNIHLQYGLDLVSGGIDPGSSHVKFIGKNSTLKGNLSFYDLTMWNSWGTYGNFYIDSSSHVTILNDMIYGGSQNWSRIEGEGKISLKGDLFAATAYNQYGGTANITINGDNDQYIYGSKTGVAHIPGLIVDKPNNSNLHLKDQLKIKYGDFMHLNGNVYGEDSSKLHVLSDFTIGAEGANASFYDFKAEHGANTYGVYEDQLGGNLEIRNSLDLFRTQLRLNSHKLTILNPDPTAIIGDLFTDSQSDFSDVLRWRIDSSSFGQSYVVNFRNEDNTNLPLSFSVTDVGQPAQNAYLSFSTYSTNPDSTINNLPAPLGLNNLHDQDGQDVSSYVIDRYWKVDKEDFNGNPKINISFPYATKDHLGSNSIILDSLAIQTWNGISFNAPTLLSYDGSIQIDDVNQNFGVTLIGDVHHPVANQLETEKSNYDVYWQVLDSVVIATSGDTILNGFRTGVNSILEYDNDTSSALEFEGLAFSQNVIEDGENGEFYIRLDSSLLLGTLKLNLSNDPSQFDQDIILPVDSFQMRIANGELYVDEINQSGTLLTTPYGNLIATDEIGLRKSNKGVFILKNGLTINSTPISHSTGDLWTKLYYKGSTSISISNVKSTIGLKWPNVVWWDDDEVVITSDKILFNTVQDNIENTINSLSYINKRDEGAFRFRVNNADATLPISENFCIDIVIGAAANPMEENIQICFGAANSYTIQPNGQPIILSGTYRKDEYFEIRKSKSKNLRSKMNIQVFKRNLEMQNEELIIEFDEIYDHNEVKIGKPNGSSDFRMSDLCVTTFNVEWQAPSLPLDNGQIVLPSTEIVLGVGRELLYTSFENKIGKASNILTDPVDGKSKTLFNIINNEFVFSSLNGGIYWRNSRYLDKGTVYQLRGKVDVNDSNEDAFSDLFHMELYYNDVISELDNIAQTNAKFNGNISAVTWMAGGSIDPNAYVYDYDGMNRIINASYGSSSQGIWSSSSIPTEPSYNVNHITYDLNGNIESFSRNGLLDIDPISGINLFGLIDDLTYQYSGNQLQVVNDLVDDRTPVGSFDFTQEFNEGNREGNFDNVNDVEYLYDDNGNMTRDENKRIVVEYNNLNLPARVTKFSDELMTAIEGSILWTYDVNGVKWRKEVFNELDVIDPARTKEYSGAFEYNAGVLEAFYHEEGRVVPTSSANEFSYEYTLKDHLGNGRVWVKYNELTEQPEVIQQADYYPFGLQHDGKQTVQSGVTNQYTFNGSVTGGVESKKEAGLGMEFVEDLGLNVHHAYYRTYDPAIGRMWQVDPKAEELYPLSPYNAFNNNPVFYTDPNGDICVPCIVFGVPAIAGGAVAYKVGMRVKNASSKEKEFIRNNSYSTSAKVFAISVRSDMAAKKEFKDFKGPNKESKTNTFRHTLGQALATKELGAEKAKEAADAHEDGDANILDRKNDEVNELKENGTITLKSESDADGITDQLNNEAGRQIANDNPDASKRELKQKVREAQQSGKLFERKKTEDGLFQITRSGGQ